MSFVNATTEKSSTNYVEPKDRIATFDQDGTLGTEHPLYKQAMSAFHRMGTMALQHSDWKETEPFKSVLTCNREMMSKFSEEGWMEIVAVTHAGIRAEAVGRSPCQQAPTCSVIFDHFFFSMDGSSRDL